MSTKRRIPIPATFLAFDFPWASERRALSHGESLAIAVVDASEALRNAAGTDGEDAANRAHSLAFGELWAWAKLNAAGTGSTTAQRFEELETHAATMRRYVVEVARYPVVRP